MALLEVKDLHASYGATEILHGVSFSVEAGEFCCIIGANGCGKTTLLKNTMGLLRPTAGSVSMDGEDVLAMDERALARRFAYIPQEHTPPFPFAVRDVVLMGRTPYLSRLSFVSAKDRRIAFDAMCQMGIEGLAGEDYTALSGGQRQLVLIARALAQQPRLLVMDEPTASLDFGNQQLVLARMRKLARAGMAVVMVTHDPDHALYCANKVVVMDAGRKLCEGTPGETITTEVLQRIYQTRVDVLDVRLEDGRLKRVCVPADEEEFCSA